MNTKCNVQVCDGPEGKLIIVCSSRQLTENFNQLKKKSSAENAFLKCSIMKRRVFWVDVTCNLIFNRMLLSLSLCWQPRYRPGQFTLRRIHSQQYTNPLGNYYSSMVRAPMIFFRVQKPNIFIVPLLEPDPRSQYVRRARQIRQLCGSWAKQCIQLILFRFNPNVNSFKSWQNIWTQKHCQ